jgi:hypothetical protein
LSTCRVVVGAASLLLLGEGDAEVVVEVAPERRHPRESPAHSPLVVLELLQRGDRRTHEGNVTAVQVGDDTVEVIGDQGASGASPALVGEPESVPEHEVIDEELRAPAEEVFERGAPVVGLESIRLVGRVGLPRYAELAVEGLPASKVVDMVEGALDRFADPSPHLEAHTDVGPPDVRPTS